MRLSRGVYPELGYILRQAQNERGEELDENSEGLAMTWGFVAGTFDIRGHCSGKPAQDGLGVEGTAA